MLDLSNRKQIAAILMTIAKKIEEDEELARSIFCELAGQGPSPSVNKGKTYKKADKIETEINIFEVYQKQGAEGLLAALASFDLKGVIKIAVDNGLDPARKIRRWRSKEKIMKQVVEIVGKQMSKGEAFLK